jgi:hypothetical protein
MVVSLSHLTWPASNLSANNCLTRSSQHSNTSTASITLALSFCTVSFGSGLRFVSRNAVVRRQRYDVGYPFRYCFHSFIRHHPSLVFRGNPPKLLCTPTAPTNHNGTTTRHPSARTSSSSNPKYLTIESPPPVQRSSIFILARMEPKDRVSRLGAPEKTSRSRVEYILSDKSADSGAHGSWRYV